MSTPFSLDAWAKAEHERKAKRAKAAETSPSRLVKKQVLKRKPKDIKMRSRSICGRTCNVVYYKHHTLLGIPIWKKYGISISPGGDKLVQELLKGITWTAWEVAGRIRYRNGETVFYYDNSPDGHIIYDSATASIEYI